MEIVLLLGLFVFLFVRLNTISGKIDNLHQDLEDFKESFKNTVSLPEPLVIPSENPLPVVPIIEKFIEQEPVLVNDSTISTDYLDKLPYQILENEDRVPNEVYVPESPRQSWWAKFREQNPDLEKFVGENIISKIGILILVLGISYFVKYAIDKNWINETARVGIGILCGATVMGFAHKLRANYSAFSSVLVAGAVAIFYFTIAIAFHQYHIFSQTVAFVLMVVITAFSVLISVSYNRMELAILSLIGGFAVPFMISTGSGNYQVLFGYIAILDVGILVITYYKKWSLVNLLAFIFTTLLYFGWLFTTNLNGQLPYMGAFVFATIFYLIFSLTNIINNLRTQGLFSKIELSVLMANTAVYFSASMIILTNYHPELKGLFTISLAVFNLICALFLYKKFGLDKKAIYLLIGLTLTFVTLTIPIQFKGNYISLFWAAEAVLMLWLAQRSQMVQFRFTSVIVQFLMLTSLFMDWEKVYQTGNNIAPIFLNSGFIAGFCADVSLVLVSLLLRKETDNSSMWGINLNPTHYQKTVQILAVVVMYFTGMFETNYQAHQYFTSFYSAASLPAAYHLVFGLVLVLFLKKYNYPKLAIIISLFNIGLYIAFLSQIPLNELQENLSLANSSAIAFILHYVSLICFVSFGWVIWQDAKTSNSLALVQQKWFVWLAALAFVYVASNEVMLHGLRFLTEPVPATSDNAYSLSSEIYGKARTLLVKVALPILWGVLAFVFLTIGIKNQWRSLRIIALALLGVTIVKLFAYDISNVSETGKIIAFILLGVLILVMSFAYQKIKKIVMNSEDEN
jgi:uncharacterized membrane protein